MHVYNASVCVYPSVTRTELSCLDADLESIVCKFDRIISTLTGVSREPPATHNHLEFFQFNLQASFCEEQNFINTDYQPL